MRRVAAYAAAALLLTVVLTVPLWPWLEAEARSGLVTAAAIAVAAQVVAFGALVRLQGRPQGFLLGFAGGVLARMGLVAAVAMAATASDMSRPRTVAVVLGLIGYLFALVLLEAWFIQDRTDSTQRTERTS